MEWARQGAQEGCLVVADHQTAGRGRLDRKWFAPPGSCLLFSMVLRPGLDLENLGLLNLCAGAALWLAVMEEGIEARLKWPNDLMLSGKKAAGILSESETAGGRVSAAITGVGVNVNLTEKDLPEEIQGSATSLSAAAGHGVDRLGLLVRFLNHFNALYSALPSSPSRVIDVYRPMCETLGRRVSVDLGSERVEGKAAAIDPTGGLVMEDGRIIRFGDVVHLR